MKEVMGLNFALFNCHINDAKEKAKKAFIKRFSQEIWNKEIQSFWKEGIMGIFREKPNEYTKWYVETVGVYVNELAE